MGVGGGSGTHPSHVPTVSQVPITPAAQHSATPGGEGLRGAEWGRQWVHGPKHLAMTPGGGWGHPTSNRLGTPFRPLRVCLYPVPAPPAPAARPQVSAASLWAPSLTPGVAFLSIPFQLHPPANPTRSESTCQPQGSSYSSRSSPSSACATSCLPPPSPGLSPPFLSQPRPHPSSLPSPCQLDRLWQDARRAC